MDKETRIKELVKEMESLGVITETREVSRNSTKGIVMDEAPKRISVEEGLIIEKADAGRGFQIYNDYNKIDKSNTKLKRLIR